MDSMHTAQPPLSLCSRLFVYSCLGGWLLTSVYIVCFILCYSDPAGSTLGAALGTLIPFGFLLYGALIVWFTNRTQRNQPEPPETYELADLLVEARQVKAEAAAAAAETEAAAVPLTRREWRRGVLQLQGNVLRLRRAALSLKVYAGLAPDPTASAVPPAAAREGEDDQHGEEVEAELALLRAQRQLLLSKNESPGYYCWSLLGYNVCLLVATVVAACCLDEVPPHYGGYTAGMVLCWVPSTALLLVARRELAARRQQLEQHMALGGPAEEVTVVVPDNWQKKPSSEE